MKKCAVINDISGFGRCSLTAAIPVISSMGIEVCPAVTGVFTAQTGFDGYASADLTEFMPQYIKHWSMLNARFDAVLTGFLLNEKQIEYTMQFIDRFKSPGTLAVVDPAMADNGSLYATHTEETAKKLLQLCLKADIITPNITELKILSGESDLEAGARKLLSLGVGAVVVTGVLNQNQIGTYLFSRNRTARFESRLLKVNGESSFSGTGDIFSAFITGRLLNGDSLETAVEKAAGFISRSIESSNTENRNYGIDFEKFLNNI